MRPFFSKKNNSMKTDLNKALDICKIIMRDELLSRNPNIYEEMKNVVKDCSEMFSLSEIEEKELLNAFFDFYEDNLLKKTQIKRLRSSKGDQILNPEVNYISKYTTEELKKRYRGLIPIVTHKESEELEVSNIWERVRKENPDKIKIKIFDTVLELENNEGIYFATVSNDFLRKCEVVESSTHFPYFPYIEIRTANEIVVSNGKFYWRYICPSLITIL